MRRSIRMVLSLFWIVAVTGSGTAPAPPDTGSFLPESPSFPPDTSTLQFHGFRAGAHLEEISRLVRGLESGRLRCKRAQADQQVTECRGAFTSRELGGEVTLWISAIDSVAGVITLSRTLPQDQLERWRDRLQARYGPVDVRSQGNQRMMQWVRRGRMLRLTWRLEGRQPTASVSLVDGGVLDAWGRTAR